VSKKESDYTFGIGKTGKLGSKGPQVIKGDPEILDRDARQPCLMPPDSQ